MNLHVSKGKKIVVNESLGQNGVISFRGVILK